MKSTSITRIVQAAIVASSLALTPLALAQGSVDAQKKAVAEALYQEGLKLLEQSKYDLACPKFAESQRLDPAMGTLVALASCYDKSGKNASAWAQYKELSVLSKKAGDMARAEAAEKKAAELEKTLSRLQINVTSDTPGLLIRRDNEEVGKAALGTPIPVDPGKHIIEATAPGYQVWQTTVNVGKANDAQAVTIPGLTATPEPPSTPDKPSPLRPAAYVVGGVGVAGLILGGVMGGLAASAASDLKTTCKNNICVGTEAQSARASANTKALVSTISFSVGGAAVATGVVLFILSRPSAPKKDEAPKKAQLIPSFGPDGGALHLVGSF